jgi:hypothetical protein
VGVAALLAMLGIGVSASFLLHRRIKAKARWPHGPYRSVAGTEVGWYYTGGRSDVAVLGSVLVAWGIFASAIVQNSDKNHVAEKIFSLVFLFLWLLPFARFLVAAALGPMGVAVTPSGVVDGRKLYRWDVISQVWTHRDTVRLRLDGKAEAESVDAPTPAAAHCIAMVIQYYLERPPERAAIPVAGKAS